jgi:hypothetical protein
MNHPTNGKQQPLKIMDVPAELLEKFLKGIGPELAKLHGEPTPELIGRALVAAAAGVGVTGEHAQILIMRYQLLVNLVTTHFDELTARGLISGERSRPVFTVPLIAGIARIPASFTPGGAKYKLETLWAITEPLVSRP